MSQPSISIAELVGSSKYAAIADDSLKDEDNAAWVLFLPAAVRHEYIELFSWIRQIDRMAENEWTEGWGSRFQIFKIGWRTLLVTRLVLPDDYHAELLLRMQRRWFSSQSSGTALTVVHAWDEYVEATAEYHRSDMVFDTIPDYQWMLEHLGGSLFQVFSFLTDGQRRAVRAFGVVDQFFNHLRDLPEDTAQGLCYFPADVLDRFGVDRQEILDGSCFRNSGYIHMMRFWLDDYLPYLYRLAGDFLDDPELHFSWRILRHWFLRRHARLQRALRVCAMDFRAATQLYYSEVKSNLSAWIEESFTAAQCPELLRAPPADLASELPSRQTPLRRPGATDSELSDLLLSGRIAAGSDASQSGSSWLVLSRQRQGRIRRKDS